MDEKIEINENVEEPIDEEVRTCQELFGQFLISVSFINIFELVDKLVIRYIAHGDTLFIMSYERWVSIGRLALVIGAFAYCLSKMKKMYYHSPATKKLLTIWGIILIPIQLINDTCVMLYTRMLQLIQLVFITSDVDKDGKIFAMIYDMTHGFKYISLFLAILLGITMTGEILERRQLIVFSGIAAVLFMIAFSALRMGSVSIEAIREYDIGINWTSLIFHLINTAGLFFVGLYIIREFKKDRQ